MVGPGHVKPEAAIRTVRKVLLSILAVGMVGIVALVVVPYVLYVPAPPDPPFHFELDRITDPTRQADYVLITDGRRQDKAWSVHRTPIGHTLPVDVDQMELDHRMFWNYSESANHFTNEHIELIGGRFLVFSRGNVRHSLYDLEEGSVLINMESPWHEYPRAGRPSRAEFHEWKLLALDEPIGALIDAAMAK